MIVEFYGLPGSGKTTLAKNLSQKNPEEFLYFHSSPRKEIIKYGFLFFLSQPQMFLFWLKELFRECLKKHFLQLFRYKLHLLLISITQYQKAKKYPQKIILLDEGLFQRILTIYEKKINEEKIKKCFANIPKIDLLVFCQNPEKEFFRFKKSPYRGESPRVMLGKKYFKNWEGITRENDKFLREKIKEKNIKFISADAVKNIGDYLIEFRKDL